jgi:hypothetical protein
VLTVLCGSQSTLDPGPVDILTAFSSNSAEFGGKLVLNLAVSLVQVRVLAIFALAEVIIYFVPGRPRLWPGWPRRIGPVAATSGRAYRRFRRDWF